jgi:hypothetical protein
MSWWVGYVYTAGMGRDGMGMCVCVCTFGSVSGFGMFGVQGRKGVYLSVRTYLPGTQNSQSPQLF